MRALRLPTAEDVTAVGSVAVLIGPSAAIVITSTPPAIPVRKLKARHEAMPLGPSPERTVARTAAKMTTDRMAAAAILRCRAGVHAHGAKGHGSGKAENVSSHSVCSFCDGRAVAPAAANENSDEA